MGEGGIQGQDKNGTFVCILFIDFDFYTNFRSGDVVIHRILGDFLQILGDGQARNSACRSLAVLARAPLISVATLRPSRDP